MGTTTRVLVVSKPVVPPWDDGSKTLVRELVSGALGTEFVVPVHRGLAWDPVRDGIVAAKQEAGRVEPWAVYRTDPGKSPGFGQKAWLMAGLVRAPRSDLVHFFFAPNLVSSMAGRLAGMIGSRPVVQTVSSAPKSYSRVKWLTFADKVVVLSRDTRDGFLSAGVPAWRLRVIYPGVTVPETVDRAGSEVRKRYGLGQDRLVLYAGDYDFSQAARTSLEAALQVCRQQTGVRFLFAGRIKNETSANVEQQLKARVAQAGLTDRIRFYNWLPDFLDLLDTVDLTVLPAESVYAKVDLPLTLLEAMARATPVVVADSGPLPELVVGDVGRLVRAQDADELARTVLGLLRDERALRVMGDQARQLVRERFSVERMAEEYEDLYGELLDGGRSRRER
ncbi:MAG: glycosyltransferase family 4 protein [Deltaproteobacteria bacterium]|nr:glycosyltransferase family 4 protein [Deltaproteobacteria bacterium]